MQRLDEATRRAVETLSQVAGVERVSVFGSYARGRRDLFRFVRQIRGEEVVLKTAFTSEEKM